jgi:hypothetical protein
MMVWKLVYVDQLKWLRAEFPSERIMVIKSEEMFENTEKVFLEVIDFLGLPRDKLANPLDFKFNFKVKDDSGMKRNHQNKPN